MLARSRAKKKSVDRLEVPIHRGHQPRIPIEAFLTRVNPTPCHVSCIGLLLTPAGLSSIRFVSSAIITIRLSSHPYYQVRSWCVANRTRDWTRKPCQWGSRKGSQRGSQFTAVGTLIITRRGTARLHEERNTRLHGNTIRFRCTRSFQGTECDRWSRCVWQGFFSSPPAGAAARSRAYQTDPNPRSKLPPA